METGKRARGAFAVGATLLMVLGGIAWNAPPKLPSLSPGIGPEGSARAEGIARAYLGSPGDRGVRTSALPPSILPPVPSATPGIASVAGTIVLANNTYISGNFPAANGVGPTVAVYDSAKGEVYVANAVSDNVSVINDTQNNITTAIEVGSSPDAIAYDSGRGEIFVSNFGSNDLSVINDTNNSVVATIPGIAIPMGVAYDSAQGEIFVSEQNTGDVAVVNDTTNTVTTVIPLWSNSYSLRGLVYDSGRGEVFVASSLGTPAYISVINATTDTEVWRVPVYDLQSIAYDSGKGEIFATVANFANASFSSVDVLSDSNLTVLANATVGGDPRGLAYDSRTGEVYVSAIYRSDVAVMNDSTNSVVATIPVGTDPLGLAYDSGRGEIFVANLNSNNVSVVNDSTHNVTDTILSGIFPQGVAYDSGRNDVFVASYYQDNVSVINASTDTAVASVNVGTYPRGLVYDSGKGEIFVENSGSNNVSVINDTTNTVVATIPVGLDPWFGIVYDPAKGEVFVTNQGSDNVSVINDTTNSVAASVGVGFVPTGLAYDSQRGEVYVTSGVTGGVGLTAINDTTDNVTSTLVLGGGSNASAPIAGLAYDPEKGELFVNTITYHGSNNVSVVNDTNDTLVATIHVGNLPEGIFYDSRNGEIIVANSGSNTLSVISDTNNTVVATIKVGSVPIFLTYDPGTAVSFDSNDYQGTLSVILDSGLPPVIDRFSATPSGLVIGASTTLEVVSSHGVGTLGYTYTGLPAGCSSRNETIVACTPSAVGNYSAGVFVNDSSGHSAHATTSLRVANPLKVTSFTISPASLLLGSSISLSVSLSGGLSPFTYSYSGLPLGCSSSDFPVFTCTPTLPGNYTIMVQVNDSAGNLDSRVALVQVLQNPLKISSLTVAPSPATLGETVVYAVKVIGGVTPYRYAFTQLPPGCTTLNTPALNCAPTSQGNFTTQVYVNDSWGFTARSTVSLVVSAPPPPLAITSFTSTPVTFVLGQSTTLNVTVDGGVPPYSYRYLGLPTGCAPVDRSTLECNPSTAGSFEVHVYVNDSARAQVNSSTAFFVSVQPPVIQNGNSPSPLEVLILLAGPTAVVAILMLTLRLLRRRRRQSAEPEMG